jgi:glycosyltransferase involved in cell wall biosynthesis
MIIHVYTVCYNEEVMLPYFFRHYKKFAHRIIVYDNGSTDKSRELVKSLGGELRELETSGKHSDRAQTKLKSEAYYESRGHADWVICVDMDEFLYHEDIVGTLAEYRHHGVTIPKTWGYDMVAKHPPTGPGQIYDEIKHGWYSWMYNKTVVFHPAVDINFLPGCHLSDPKGPVSWSESAKFKLLHYRYLGADFWVQRYMGRMSRISEDNMNNGWGIFHAPPGVSLEASIRHVHDNDIGNIYKGQIVKVL